MIDYDTQKKKKLLLTGANGKIGRLLHKALKNSGSYDILATDIEPNRDHNVVQLDVTDAARLEALTIGVHTVLHFAWAKDKEDFLGKVLPLNVTGAYHLYEAARKNGVKRIIFASSNHVTGFYRVGEQVKPEDPYRPDSFYGLSKCYIELLGRYYADKYGISSINIRIGNFSGTDRPLSERASHIWISSRDMVQLTVCCIEADPSIDFLCLYGTSANTSNYYDIGYLEDLIGYKPDDNAAALLEEEIRLGTLPPNNIPFQGGMHAITSHAEEVRESSCWFPRKK
ncbi:NAD-dependent epimerase/dehydratase family protein [Bacillus litorisediminis]|uniref:NAD-dependent epimerase/dehydratase family protein n=1 Tax=Bacillus litorisediminis TaxID=2922713 RepID=UPI001FAD6B5E|nr:NAD(P)-dependent oxidoreductase [Bacillus litorisediminis]